MFRGYHDSNPTPGIEVNFHPAPAGFESGDQVVQEQVGKVFVESALVAECPEVQLQGFGLHDLLVGDIAD